jgi:tRNA (cytidine/uridine-2'-O-)-methyltransferase
MFHVILVQPEIPPNTGNVIRLCANTGARLHLVKPLGFTVDDAKLRRAGLDYHDWQPIAQHDNLEQAIAAIGTPADRVFAITTKGTRLAGETTYLPGDVFVFGCETAGLSAEQMALFAPEQRLRLPMLPTQRSLNLSNAVAVLVFEAWRQQGYAGAN